MASYNVLLWQLKLPLPPQRYVSQDCIVNAILPLMYHQTGIPICGFFRLKSFTTSNLNLAVKPISRLLPHAPLPQPLS